MSGESDVHEAEEAHEGIKHEANIIAVDIGTTSLRSHVYDNHGHIKASSSKKIELIHPKPGWSEMDPELLYKQVVACVDESIKAAGIKVSEVTCLGIAVQRNTCLTWDSKTGKPFHNFITWQDLRARDYVKSWNTSLTLKALNSGSKVLHTFTRKKRFLSASVLKFMSPQVTLRLLWILDNIPDLRKKALDGEVKFGCIESWLLWKLTGSQVHATDFSCASATGLYDPFLVSWSTIVCGLVNIPMNIFPDVLPTSGVFGHVDESVFGSSIPITCLVGDQSASMFGECCFDVGDIKCTLGTGMFIDLNTGEEPHASIAGLYPLIGWKIGDRLTYIAEGIAADTGSTIQWAEQIGLFEDVRDTASIAESVEDTDGVYFVPAFCGLQAPINDDKATTLMIGMTPSTTKAHLTRAILESIAFRFKLLYETVLSETKIPLSYIRVDGGVCNNDFLVQLMADLTNQVINKSTQTDNMSSLGTAFFAGLAVGVWKDVKELEKIRLTEREFHPQPTWQKYKPVFHQWERAVSRSQKWYEES
ncbi:putative glycerol kinase 5 isoform X2 [Ruditapes philippinarum]|uniref:putative glycerol kinase 5 isoform X2 n=1 Tax=Ruditapes philippinarum TaxID=129788 RepID=UPI00295ABEAB|nr:putative glycerol kinase 5 isoform X2 [Ruditapes philippinarum]